MAFEIYETGHMGEVAERRGAQMLERLAPLRDHPLVCDIRRRGMWMALELQNPKTGTSLKRGLYGKWQSAPLLSRTLLEHGLAAARMSEGLLHVAPPYIATDSDLDFIAEQVAQVLDAVTPELSAM